MTLLEQIGATTATAAAQLRNGGARRLLLTVLALVPFLLGWLVGIALALVLWTWAAIVAGFKTGMGRG